MQRCYQQEEKRITQPQEQARERHAVSVPMPENDKKIKENARTETNAVPRPFKGKRVFCMDACA